MVGVVTGQLVLETVDGRQCHLRAVKLGDRDGPVEGDDRRGVEADELVVEGDDLRFGTPLVGGPSPLLRTPLPRSDTASRISGKVGGALARSYGMGNHSARMWHGPAAVPARGCRWIAWQLCHSVSTRVLRS